METYGQWPPHTTCILTGVTECCCLLLLLYRKVLKQIAVSELQPDETVDAVREARLLAKVGCGLVGGGVVYFFF